MTAAEKELWPIFCISIRVPSTGKTFEWTCEINPDQSAYCQEVILGVLDVAMDKLVEVLKAEKVGAR